MQPLAGVRGKLPAALLGDLYAAAAEPAQWPRFIEKACAHVGAQRAALFGYRPRGLSPSAPEAFSCVTTPPGCPHQHLAGDPRFLALKRVPPPLVVSDTWFPDLLDARYREPLRAHRAPHDRRHLLAIMSDASAGSCLALLFQRSLADGPFALEHLDFGHDLEPHLRQAIKIQRRIMPRSTTETGLKTTLDLLATGIIFLDEAGRVIHLNRSAIDIVAQDDGFGFAPDGLHAWGRAGTERLRELVNRTISTRKACSMVLGRPSAKRPYTVLSKALSEHSVEPRQSASSAVLFIVDAARGMPSLAESVATLYGLTPAEIRLAMGLIDDLDLDTIAKREGIAKETARGHLKHILRKTGTSRQGQLIRLLLVTLAGVHSD